MPNEQDDHKISEELLSTISKMLIAIVLLLIGLISLPIIFYYTGLPKEEKTTAVILDKVKKDTIDYWIAYNVNTITDTALKTKVEYGSELIAHTAQYLGPNGSVLKISNGMNCQNCHLDAGTKIWGNNYGSVASLYPKFRARSGKIENIYKRVNDCFERSLNGNALDTNSKEMQAITAYIEFLGSNVEKGKKAEGSGFKDLAYLDRATDPEKGKLVYAAKCQSCHQPNGEGVLNTTKTEFTFPPLWGKDSYNDGAGLYRISNFAKYAKYNMPQGVTYDTPLLSDEEAWDVAAYVNSQTRPHINVSSDWPDISKKPVDHPFGPHADKFNSNQHKYGPYKPIADDQKKRMESDKSVK